MPPVVADEDGHAGRLGGFRDPFGSLDGVGDRFLDEDGHSRFDGGQGTGCVQVVGRGQDGPVDLVEDVVEIARDARGRAERVPVGLEGGVHDVAEFQPGVVLDSSSVFAPDQAGPDDGDAHGTILSTFK
ncbi:hypothetical protein GCM10027563_01540 [Parasphingorhabdus pacifica]